MKKYIIALTENKKTTSERASLTWVTSLVREKFKYLKSIDLPSRATIGRFLLKHFGANKT